MSLSTSEAEYVAASQWRQEVLYLREILRDFGYPPLAQTRVYEDNLACIAMSENPLRRKFSRHIDIRRYFVRDFVAHKILTLVPLRTHMVADALTKSLPAPAHTKHRDVMIGKAPFCTYSAHCPFFLYLMRMCETPVSIGGVTLPTVVESAAATVHTNPPHHPPAVY